MTTRVQSIKVDSDSLGIWATVILRRTPDGMRPEAVPPAVTEALGITAAVLPSPLDLPGDVRDALGAWLAGRA